MSDACQSTRCTQVGLTCHLSLHSRVTALACHCNHLSLYSLLTALACHCTHMSLHSLVTVLTCHCTHVSFRDRLAVVSGRSAVRKSRRASKLSHAGCMLASLTLIVADVIATHSNQSTSLKYSFSNALLSPPVEESKVWAAESSRCVRMSSNSFTETYKGRTK